MATALGNTIPCRSLKKRLTGFEFQPRQQQSVGAFQPSFNRRGCGFHSVPSRYGANHHHNCHRDASRWPQQYFSRISQAFLRIQAHPRFYIMRTVTI